MRRTKENKGITLIALVITIIILLILAGVAIGMATGDSGILNKASKAGEEWEAGRIDEENKLNEYEDYLDNYGNNLIEDNIETELSDVVSMGDYVAYEPVSGTWNWDTIVNGNTYQTYSGSVNNTGTLITEDLNWRVLDVEDGQVKLISDKTTSSTVALSGVDGYNNAVKILDDLCSTLYSSSIGIARNIKIEDIEEKLKETVLDAAKSSSGYGCYGTPYATPYAQYPNIWENENGSIINNSESSGVLGLSEQDRWYTGSSVATTSIAPLRTWWCTGLRETEFESNIFYVLYVNNGEFYNPYWLSSRCVSGNSPYAEFATRYLNFSDIGSGKPQKATWMTSWNVGTPGTLDFGLRPVITLESGIQINRSDTTKDGSTAERAWQIQ